MSDCDTDDARPAASRLEEAVSRLTQKERECLSRWLHHATAKEIALDLGITHHAVEKRLKSARQRLGVSTSLEAARLVERIEGYDRTVSGSPELSRGTEPADIPRHAAARPETPGLSRRRAMVSGVILMSILLTTLAVTLAGQPTVAPVARPDAQSSTVSYIGIDESLDRKIAQSFAKLDRDGSGFLESSEIEGSQFNILRKTPSTSADRPVRAASLAQADTNADGRISSEEYARWFEGLLRTKP